MIKLMVDSASDCKLVDGIVDYIVPITINVDGCEYKGTELSNNRFYELLGTSQRLPCTSQPSPQEFIDIFEQIKTNGDSLIYLAMSSKLSGTYQGACMAREMVEYDKIYIIDTLAVTHQISLLAEYARNLIKSGEKAEQIVKKCEAIKCKIRVLAGLDTLEYLYKGGRLSRASATVGGITGVKPVVTTEDGCVKALGKCLGKLRAMSFILDKIKNFEVDMSFPIYSLYTFGTENCKELEEKLEQNGYKTKSRLQIGPTIGTHVGPGVYAVVFVEK